MDNKLIYIIIGILLVAGIGYAFKTSSDSLPVVSAVGTSSLNIKPDTAAVNINIQTTGKTIEGANEQNKNITEKVYRELEKIGISREEVETSGFSSNPDYDWSDGKQTLKGYTVTNSLVVRTGNFNKVGDIAEAVLDSGALVSWLSFELSKEKQNELKQEALRLASEDAKAKAEATVEGAGGKLGKLVSIESLDYGYQPWYYYSASSDAGVASRSEILKVAEDNTNPSEQEITASVRATYKVRT